MPSNNHSASSAHKDYVLITNVVANTDAEVDLNAETWQLPYTIDDSDLTFDGKPLNMLYEENRWMAEHHVYQSHDTYSSHSSSGKEKSHKSSRGRSRQRQK